MSITLLCLLAMPAAQHPRAPVLAETTLADASAKPALASAGNLSVLAFADGGPAGTADEILVATSDGRGLEWSTPVRVDGGPLGTTRSTQRDSAALVGGHVYVAWNDDRWGNNEVYFNRSNDGGVTWAGEVRINTTLAAGMGTVRHWRMVAAADPGGGQDHVYFLLNVTEPGGPLEGLFLAASHDSGNTFLAPVHVPWALMPFTVEMEEIDLAVENGVQLHVLWQDDRGGPLWNVWFQRSANGGANWLMADRLVTSTVQGRAEGPIALDVEGFTVVAAWEDARNGGAAGPRELRSAASANGGLNWSMDYLVGGYVPGADDVNGLDTRLNGAVQIATWCDNRTGTYEAYAATGPVGFPGPDWQLSTGGARQPLLRGPEVGGSSDYYAVSWLTTPTPPAVQSAYTRTSGAAWSPVVKVSDNPGECSQAAQAFNLSYNNFVHAWVADDAGLEHCYAGGYRPATLTLVGTFAAGQAVSFELDGFPASQTGYLFAVLLAGGTGASVLPWGDGRLTGLLFDAYTTAALNKLSTSFSGVLNANGEGASVAFAFPPAAAVPPGTTLYLVAVAAETVGVPSFGALTDLESVTVQ